jgi:hypothetical protein
MMVQVNSSPGLSSLFTATAKKNSLLLSLTVGQICKSAHSKFAKVKSLAAFVKLGHRKRCYTHAASRCNSKTRQDVVSCFAHALHNLRTIRANFPLVNMTGSSMASLVQNFNLIISFSNQMQKGSCVLCMHPCLCIIIS